MAKMKIEISETSKKEMQYTWHLIKQSRLALIGLILVLVLVFFAIFGPFLVPHDPLEVNYAEELSPPSWAHPLGTDHHGRDLLSRVMAGTRISFTVGMVVVALSLLIGGALGILAGFFGGLIDEVIMRGMDMVMSFPDLVLAMAIMAAIRDPLKGYSIDPLICCMIAIATVTIPRYARLLRGQALSLKDTDFVESAKAVGCSNLRLMLAHILPNCLAPLMVQATMTLGSAVLTAAGLSFLGLGAQPPTPEWGAICVEGRNFLPDYWWISTFPGLAILLFVLAFNLLGDGLRDVLDPSLRR